MCASSCNFEGSLYIFLSLNIGKIHIKFVLLVVKKFPGSYLY